MALFSTAYMANVLYYGTILCNGRCTIELNENYTKQTYRNRCTILSANGAINLTVPIVKISGEKMPIKEVKIDYATPWQKLHMRSIMSAYRNSPYFEHY
ncbi:MAG: WbqC family protein, partial [Rikenellaceae bacterium]